MLLCGLFSSCGKWGWVTLRYSSWASHYRGFSCCRAQPLGCVGSVVATSRLQSTGSIVMAHGLSCSMAWGIFADQGSNLCLLHWHVNSLPLSHHGSPAKHSTEEEVGVQSPEFTNGRASHIDSQAYELSIAPHFSCLESSFMDTGHRNNTRRTTGSLLCLSAYVHYGLVHLFIDPMRKSVFLFIWIPKVRILAWCSVT